MFTLGSILKVLGLIVILLIIWLASDYVQWLENPTNMFMAMAVPVALLAAWETFKRARAIQANNKLSSAVVDQAKAEPRPSGDVVQLRERFEEAVAMLKQQKKRGGLGLYELPWYVIIGAPGSGKTTALKYSGLKFPLEQRSGRGATRGVGGTRNCDWWFTEEAVLLDTAGRYTTQDSDASADSTGWAEFLALLKKYRKRRPLNGVLLAISAQDLMTQGQAGREAHVLAARRRLTELNKELRIQLPVYVLVTKSDLIAGFSEYFDDMSQEERAQVLGVTFPQDVTYQGAAANAFPAEFDAVVQRLNERVYARLEDEHDARRRAKIFGFPQQMASLREGLADFIGEVFETSRFDQRVLLRGVYFTSGTQEGTPIDRLLGALSRRIAVASDAVTQPGKGKAYFIERLMKQVVLAESGLAGVSRKLELQKAAAQFGLYIATLVVGGIALLLMANSYRTNAAFVAEFDGRARRLIEDLGRPDALPVDPSIPGRPRLDRIRAFIDDIQTNRASWVWRGWGLDQSHSVAEAAGILYKAELQQALVRPVNERIEQRLGTLVQGRDFLAIYETLRAYLMLGRTRAAYFDTVEVRNIARREWEAIYRGREDDIASTDNHFAWLLETGLQETPVKDALVGSARNAIPPSAVPAMLLSRIKREYEKQVAPDGQMPPAAIDGRNFKLKTKSGRVLGAGLPVVFTKKGFQATDSLIKTVETTFRDETWVWDRTPPAANDTRNEVWRLYEDGFIDQWKRVLDDVGVPANSAEIAEYISRVSGENEGLKSLFTIVDSNTSLVEEVYEKPDASVTSPRAWIASAVNRLQGRTKAPGSRVTAYFEPIHWLVTEVNGKVLIDEILASLRPIAALVKSSDPNAVGSSPGGSTVQVQQSVESLKQSAGGLPLAAASVSALFEEMGSAATSAAAGNLIAEIDGPHRSFIDSCQKVISNRFPFFPDSAEDATPDDLKSVFGAGGAFDVFWNKLTPYVDNRAGDYAAKEVNGQPLRIGAALDTLKRVDRIRRYLLPRGNAEFTFRMSVADAELVGRFERFEVNEILFNDGKKLDYRNQYLTPKAATWPTKPGLLEARFFDRSGMSEAKPGYSGHWNLFRLIKHGELKMATETTFTLRFTAGSDYIVLGIQADSMYNPLVLFASGDFQKFRCR